MESVKLLSKANTKFALDLWQTLNKEDKVENLFYSPFSISAALAMVLLGARENTAKEMSEVLHFSELVVPQSEVFCQQTVSQVQTRSQTRTQTQQASESQDDEGDKNVNVNEIFAKLLKLMDKPEALYELNVANRLYGEQTFQFLQLFLSETEKYFNAELKAVDFRSSAEPTRIVINEWVKTQTKDKIVNLLPPNSLDSSTKLVLVNAIYFKGKWQAQFKEEHTVDGQFWINKNDSKPVKLMQQTSNFPFKSIKDLDIKILELPYKGNDLSMIIMLPNQIEDDTTGLEKAEMNLTFGKFMEMTTNMEKVKVYVSLPKFKMEKSFELSKALASMGMKDVFDSNTSDLSGMSEEPGLAVTGVVHKAFVEVNEEGTEAAAATGVVIGTTSVDPLLETFKADHPFLFFIRHNASNSVLFAGRFTSPQ